MQQSSEIAIGRLKRAHRSHGIDGQASAPSISSQLGSKDKNQNLVVPIIVESAQCITSQPVTMGLPFPAGDLFDHSMLSLTKSNGIPVLLQAETMARWPDGSIRWLLLDFMTNQVENCREELLLSTRPSKAGHGPTTPFLQIEEQAFVVKTDKNVVRITRGIEQPILQIVSKGREILDPSATNIVLTDVHGHSYFPCIERAGLETAGPVRTTIRLNGSIGESKACRFVARVSVYPQSGFICLRFTLHNPRRARHRGGLWDLGDVGSYFFRDLSVNLVLNSSEAPQLRFSVRPDQSFQSVSKGPFEIYQDSSGGENWSYRTHVNRLGKVQSSFKGYRLTNGAKTATGDRAIPVVRLMGSNSALTVALPEFWQQFPKAIDSENGTMSVRLFPKQFADAFELQGGEQKTHSIWLHFGGTDTSDTVLNWVHSSTTGAAQPEWYASSGAFSHLVPAAHDQKNAFDQYLKNAIGGPDGLLARRETIDEFGWRNYGEIPADHENTYYDGPKPVVSHYNNQFDSVFGAILQFARTGDRRWRELSDPLARHVIDIDIYHTLQDRAAYNGGLFWMTDHYKDAATSTHRTYSRANQTPGQPYGGGPGCEHNFTTGLLYYFYLTGDRSAREAVLSLADWVVRMDDGRLNIASWIDSGPTGLASSTSITDYHGPGRGPGFSINALLDGWQLTGRTDYLAKADELISRCIHPADDIEARDLLNAELRWSYTVFLVTLVRYLQMKSQAGILDTMYSYARASLLKYADWMVNHERPYFDQRNKLEFPTETWAAQEFRKANAMRLAAAYADESLRTKLLKRGLELADRAWNDLLSFESCGTARAIAILMIEGSVDQYFRFNDPALSPIHTAERDFGRPMNFIAQKHRVRRLLTTPHGVVKAFWRLIWPPARRASVRQYLPSFLKDLHEKKSGTTADRIEYSST